MLPKRRRNLRKARAGARFWSPMQVDVTCPEEYMGDAMEDRPNELSPPKSSPFQVFLDFCCPFSAKMYKTLKKVYEAAPGVLQGLQFVIHLVPQPWHPQSPILHEVGLAIRDVAGDDGFFAYADLIFSEGLQLNYFDSETFEMTRKGIYEKLIDQANAAGVINEEQCATVLAFVGIETGGEEPSNAGNRATGLLKFCVKYHRIRAIHVTPTVLVNGIEAPDISSGWTCDQFLEKLKSL